MGRGDAGHDSTRVDARRGLVERDFPCFQRGFDVVLGVDVAAEPLSSTAFGMLGVQNRTGVVEFDDVREYGVDLLERAWFLRKY